MQPDDEDHTVVRARPEILPVRGSGGRGEPEDIEADTVIRGPETAQAGLAPGRPAPGAPPALVEPAALIEPHSDRDSAAVGLPALIEPPRGHPVVVERSVRPREGLPTDPNGLTVPWYRIRVNRHEPIPLDAPALIGRNPVAPRIAIGGVPRLVRVPSPGREVSSTHLELRQQGASVIVTDLRSTNGTVVSIPGTSSQKLRQGESLVVSAGTVVDIGDGNLVEILPIERLV
ncbi:FHA domain-containing protein [Glaciihabitans sp. INWT7]|uniref:FHA domain-containing protein n=1 Tax=Glaciihabitans sp. INWT7 TaxID=2596912 RepID=UPI002104C520|nr:FHA domain-containing protein [Glaciihabitans sp. INWT7]